jgi:hypothetical protein
VWGSKSLREPAKIRRFGVVRNYEEAGNHRRATNQTTDQPESDRTRGRDSETEPSCGRNTSQRLA